MSRTLRTTFAVLALTLLLAGAARAQPLGGRTGPAGVLDRVTDWISSLWSLPGETLSAAWEEAGGFMDPDGRPSPASHGEGTDAGGFMDPNG